MNNPNLLKQKLGSPIAFYPALAKLFGNLYAGIFLCQLMYWSDKGRTPGGWIYKTQAQWKSETFLTRRQQERAREILKEHGVLAERRKGTPAKLYYKIDWDVLTRLYETANRECTNTPNKNGGKRQSITETTTETTTENEPIDKSMWPESYLLLSGINGFQLTLEDYQEWAAEKSVPEDLLSKKAYALRDWLLNNPKGKKRAGQKNFNPWLTFTSWVTRDFKPEPETRDRQRWGNG